MTAGVPTSQPEAPLLSEPPLLLDTHVLVWLMLGEPALGPQAKEAIRTAATTDRVLVSAITPWEIAMLVSKNRLTLNRDVLNWLQEALKLPGIKLAELSLEISVASTRLPWPIHADPADRILAATARHFSATLLTADEKLLHFAGKHLAVMNAQA